MKISAKDHRIIRQCAKDQAKRWVGASKVSSIEVGERFNLDTEKHSTNIFDISNDPEWNDTDLWTTHPLTGSINKLMLVDGKGLFDLYVYTDDGLACNIQAEFDEQGLLAVHADIDNNIWKRNA